MMNSNSTRVFQRGARTVAAWAIALSVVAFVLINASAAGRAAVLNEIAALERRAEDAKNDPNIVFPWRSDKQGNVMLLQRLRYDKDGKPMHRESVMRVIPAARFKASAGKIKPTPTKLAKVKHKVAEWHVQKNGDVILLQHRLGLDQKNKPAHETALV